ncbi:MAG: hypothetical protein IPF77_20680 [Gemmatimonadetes bacterium]|nr:hypothetical protein [Gemmatimonadota bacterium]
MLAAVLNMTATAAGFLTNHLADVTGPAWLYIATRGLAEPGRSTRIQRLVGRTPARAALLLFLASTATEVSQIFWPTGLFRGRFDPWDVAAFAAGILPLYLLDRRCGAVTTPTAPDVTRP